MAPRKSRVVGVKPAGPDHQVVSVESSGGKASYRRTPCSDCPWRTDSVGEFPAEAFRHSARTAYDMATETFACYQSGKSKPAICAGFLLQGAHHNLTVRLKRANGEIKDDVHAAGHELFESYTAMATENGVEPDDPVLRRCR